MTDVERTTNIGGVFYGPVVDATFAGETFLEVFTPAGTELCRLLVTGGWDDADGPIDALHIDLDQAGARDLIARLQAWLDDHTEEEDS